MKIKSTEQSVDIFISPFNNINQVKYHTDINMKYSVKNSLFFMNFL